jgi:L-asparaginase II
MANPVLVEVLRGATVESRHRGAIVAMDADGGIVLEIGDVDAPVFPRSAVKAIQALPFVESGAADAFGFGQKELALACASHSGEPEHAALAARMLSTAAIDPHALECGTHWPMDEEAKLALARKGAQPTALHNNCSGKHAAFLCTCEHLGHGQKGYVGFSHPYQRLLRAVMEEVTGAAHGEANMAVDGCSIPTYAVPLRALALGFARMAAGTGFSPERARAARRLLSACMAEPFHVSGTGRMDLRLMQAGGGRVFVKTGAEGVYCAAVPELGLGIALKCDDGATRGAETMVAAVLSRLMAKDASLSARLDELARPSIHSRRGVEVGSIRPKKALTGKSQG